MQIKNKKTIALISSLAPTLVNFRGPLIADMVRQGHRVLAFAPDFDAETRLAVQNLGAETVDYSISRTGRNPIGDLVAMMRLAQLLRQYSPDISFSYFIKPVIYGTLAARLAGVRQRFAMMEGLGFVFTTDKEISLGRRFLQTITSALFRISLTFADRLLFLNSDDRDEFLQRNLIAPGKTAVLGGIGVDLTEWSYSRPSLTPITFVFVGRLLRDKGVEEFAAAAKAMRDKGHSALFVMLGGYDENPTAIPLSLIHQWVDDAIVEWPGHVQIQHALKQASVFVLPSYREGVPRSTQEAMALGLPVITTDVPGCRDTVIDGMNGFLVPAKDACALASAMEYFIEKPHRIIPMGLESRRIAQERFDVREQNRKMLSLIGL